MCTPWRVRPAAGEASGGNTTAMAGCPPRPLAGEVAAPLRRGAARCSPWPQRALVPRAQWPEVFAALEVLGTELMHAVSPVGDGTLSLD